MDHANAVVKKTAWEGSQSDGLKHQAVQEWREVRDEALEEGSGKWRCAKWRWQAGLFRWNGVSLRQSGVPWLRDFRPWHPAQASPLPASPSDWLPDGHQVTVLPDLLDELNLSQDLIPARARDPHVSRTMLLLCACCVGIGSSCRIGGDHLGGMGENGMVDLGEVLGERGGYWSGYAQKF